MLTQKRTLSRLAAENGQLCFGPDRREYPRVAFDCSIEWNPGGGNHIADRMGWACNASEGGACFTLRNTHRPAVGEIGRLVFQVDNYYKWLVAQRAIVEWCKPIDGGLCKVGVRLCQPDDKTTSSSEND